jgi:hypothetical protein
MVDRWVDIQVGYNESLDIVLPLIRNIVHELDEAHQRATRLLEEPVVAAVESMAGGPGRVRIIARCAPDENPATHGRSASGSRPLSTRPGSGPGRLCRPKTAGRLVPAPEPETMV